MRVEIPPEQYDVKNIHIDDLINDLNLLTGIFESDDSLIIEYKKEIKRRKENG